jgi:ABC-type dipeptide/oligopeptide/nickel transport system permease component
VGSRLTGGLPGAVLRRLVQALATLLFASILIWSLILLTPGDPARRVLNARGVENPRATQIAAVHHELGLDRPAYERYASWLGHAIRGDFGTSWKSDRPVRDELFSRLPATLTLLAAALPLAIGLAVLLGCIAGSRPRRWPDAAVRALTVLLAVVPSFLLATVVIKVLIVRWGAFRVVTDGSWSTVFPPALTLAVGAVAVWVRLLRSGLLTARSAPYLEVARARGVSPTRRLLRHALPNTLVPFLTVIAVEVATLLAGAPVVESVFTWPGVGRYAVAAIQARDVPVVQGFTLLAVLAYVVVSMLVDVAAMLLDPRLRDGRVHASAEAGVFG